MPKLVRGTCAARVLPEAAGALPVAFCLFRAGWNRTENGDALFDAAAAAAVMAAYQRHGVDRMIDLEHLSLEDPAKSSNYDPDARGWFRLELRADGSLWAVDVRWTDDGAARLNAKRQRYISPAFLFDGDTRRITRLLNVAITALPATHGTAALMAASIGYGDDLPMSKELLAVLGLEEGATLEDVIASIGALKSKLDAALGTPPAEPPPAELPPLPPLEADGGPPAPPAEDEDEDEDEQAAASLLRLTARPTLAEAARDIAAWRASHVALEADRARLAKERATLEAGERRSLVASLVRLGVELPATAWEDDRAQRPVPRLASEPIAELRARVAKHTAARTGTAPATPAQPTTDAHGLTERQLRICRETGCKPEDFAALAKRRGAVARVD